MPSALRTLSAVGAALAIAASSYTAGRLTAPDPVTSAPSCTEPRQVYRRYIGSITPEQEMAERKLNGRMLANTVLQNPNCFDASQRAMAQTILDTIDQGG